MARVWQVSKVLYSTLAVTKIDPKLTIHVTMLEVLEASLASGAVLISYGAILGVSEQKNKQKIQLLT